MNLHEFFAADPFFFFFFSTFCCKNLNNLECKWLVKITKPSTKPSGMNEGRL